MKFNFFAVILGLFFIALLPHSSRSQEDFFKGKKYTFDLLDQKNPVFSEADLIKDISSLNGVIKCKYIKETKKVVIYATSIINIPIVRPSLKKQNLGILNFVGEDIRVTNLETINETN